MSQVNLLPPEIHQRVRARRQAVLIAIGGAGLIVLLLFFWGLKSAQLRQVNNQITAQDAVNASLTGQIEELQPFQDLATELEGTQALVDSALAGEVSWSAVLRDVQLVMPNDMSLDSLTGSLEAGAAGDSGVALAGNISFSGESQGTLRLARWLARLVEVRGWVNSWLTSAQETGPGTKLYTFQTTVDLLPEAETARGRGGAVG